ncbi:hypothetical protein PGT21_005226 [Puccinia graminis f. sp. tritici]|uniref:non-specific serine/threonine protein kinase n=1 Tax=Puccinia graminis f. sp. tritici TaxID=56615 RepID=A0A5B0RD18_PUCGR|nr:hypothetical protein PGT21_005226 [Puccinia graminis f. sp. tritici]KAA1123302.1 hypothetical protein PGTUg99_000261 [Puccinia graminis f. sp. tritici]
MNHLSKHFRLVSRFTTLQTRCFAMSSHSSSGQRKSANPKSPSSSSKSTTTSSSSSSTGPAFFPPIILGGATREQIEACPFYAPSPPEPHSTLDQPYSPPDPIWYNSRRDGPPDLNVPGGNHSVNIGDQFHDNRYKVVRKLGWGSFSTVWLAHDQQLDRHVALKIVKSAKDFTETAELEIKLHQRVSSANPDHLGYHHMAILLDHFTHEGPNGTHVCMVFEALGENLAGLNSRLGNGGIPQSVIRDVGRQVLLGLDYLHRECGITHTGIKPENILICIEDIEKLIRSELEKQHNTKTSAPICTPQLQSFSASSRTNHSKEDHSPIMVKIADLGDAAWSLSHRLTNRIQTRQYRSPDVIVGVPWNQRIDMWSVGCLFFELLTGNYLFHSPEDSDHVDQIHLMQIIDLVGPFPLEMALSGRYTHGIAHEIASYNYKQAMSCQEWNLEIMMSFYGFDKSIIQCLYRMLQIDPSKRCEAKEILDDKKCWLGAEK